MQLRQTLRLLLIAGVLLAFAFTPWFIPATLLAFFAGAGGAAARARRAYLRAREHAAVEAHAETTQELATGPRVLEGEVAYADGAQSAMHVELEQVGSERESSGTWSHSWTEVFRKLTVQPFYLRLQDGRYVRVEPEPERSQLFDDFENAVLVHQPTGPHPMRSRRATLMPGERVWITGRLNLGVDPERGRPGAVPGDGYRAPMQTWIMRGAPTLLVSSVSLGEHFRQRAKRHRHDAILYLLASLPLLFTREISICWVVAGMFPVFDGVLVDLNLKELPWYRSKNRKLIEEGGGQLLRH